MLASLPNNNYVWKNYMKEMLVEIKNYIKNNSYTNEENVRFSLVARVLQKLGWDIWNPQEVSTEYRVSPNEDSTRVDIALLKNSRIPYVFIEIKAIGKLEPSLSEHEIQLRNYNRDNTAIFSIITDGRLWRFYYSQTQGDFSHKCFKILDIQKHDLEDIELLLYSFLSKDEIISGNAEKEANTYLKLRQKQRYMEDVIHEARMSLEEPPYPSLPDTIIVLVQKKYCTNITKQEASTFIEKYNSNKSNESHQPSKPEIIKETSVHTSAPNKSKSSSPPVNDWINQIPELKGITPSLKTWKSICQRLNIDLRGASARLKLEDWVKENKPEWPEVPQPIKK